MCLFLRSFSRRKKCVLREGVFWGCEGGVGARFISKIIIEVLFGPPSIKLSRGRQFGVSKMVGDHVLWSVHKNYINIEAFVVAVVI